MNRLLLSLLLLFILLFSFSQNEDSFLFLNEYKKADSLYVLAEKLSLRPDYNDATEAQESKLNETALKEFQRIISRSEKYGNDSLRFQLFYKTGVLEHYFDSIDKAKLYYEKALALQLKKPLADSFFFKPHIFIGGIFYRENKFDSALLHYKAAEKIAQQYTVSLEESNRLYNTMGSMYYETGNYYQAKNYFEKAITLLNNKQGSYKDIFVNYKINLASTLNRLELFVSALNIYNEILSYNVSTPEILFSIGLVKQKLHLYNEALQYFRQVNFTGTKKINLLNEMGLAHDSLNNIDSAFYYYQLAEKENTVINGTKKTVAHGLTLKYTADALSRKGDFNSALKKYQQAIICLDDNFNDTTLEKNPTVFSNVFSYTNLFATLTGKADAFVNLSRQTKKTEQLQSALEAYNAAFKLADYVETTYESDESRLFLNKIKYTVHSKPIDICIDLLEKTKNEDYLQQAYNFDQRNKASILSLNLQEAGLGQNSELRNKERDLKNEITSLSLKISATTDSINAQSITSAILDKEIALGKLHEQLMKDPKYQQLQLTGLVPSVSVLQKKMLDNKTALLSYHLGDTSMLVLCITNKSFLYHRLALTQDFFKTVKDFITALHNTDSRINYSGTTAANALYQKLIQPLANSLQGKQRLLIIPDDELNYVPFEALQNEKKEYLVQKFAVQYQYSTALLNILPVADAASKTLAMAPFANTATDSFAVLPFSFNEIQKTNGLQLINENATKQAFLKNANKYGIIHLATHASVNDADPQQSYIAFYPNKNDSVLQYKLFAEEIYNLKLDSTKLVILSACETGTGQLVRGEGMMSLSRAFAYAGCPDIITSLWKAEDKTTAFIIAKMSDYLEKGMPEDIALQRAKNDLFSSTQIDPRFKTPQYWSHLIFIGEYQPQKKSHYWWWIGAAIIALCAALLVKRKSRQQMLPGQVSHR